MKRIEDIKIKAFKLAGKFYNETAELYEEMSKREDPKNIILKTILRDTTFKNKVVLDLGVGSGKSSIPLAKKSKFVYALDISKPLLNILRNKIKKSRIKNIKILEAGYPKIPLPKDSIDIIISSWSFPAHSENWEKDFTEVKRVLKKDGKIIIIELAKEGEYQSILTKVFHESVEKILLQEKWLKSHGFKKKYEFDILMDFGSKKNIDKFGNFWGSHVAEYLLDKNKTGFRVGIAIFYFKK